MSSPSESAARQARFAEVPPTVPERVAFVRQLMVAGQFVTGQTSYELAEAWGLSFSTVAGYSSEASRQIRASLGPPEEIQTKLFGWLDEAAQMARQEGGAKGAQALVGAAKEYASLAGVAAPQKVQVDGLADLLAMAFKHEGTNPSPT